MKTKEDYGMKALATTVKIFGSLTLFLAVIWVNVYIGTFIDYKPWWGFPALLTQIFYGGLLGMFALKTLGDAVIGKSGSCIE